MEGASYSRKWTDDPHLSHLIADNLLNAVGDPQNQRLRRHIMDVLDHLDSVGKHVEMIRSGSCAEGFRIQGSDVDQMYVDKLTKVVTVTPENLGKYLAVVKMVQPPGIPPGYFKLIVLTPFTFLAHIRDATRKLCGEYYLSNEAFLETFQQSSKSGVRHGPCVLETDDLGTDHDRAFCLEFKEWPRCADEWIIRKRRYGWPSEELVSKIKKEGCHLMAIGSKHLNENYDCTMPGDSEWAQDPLQWRLSFSVAEKALVYSFNDTQFLTYGILKLLNQEVFSGDPILKSGICSYFLKSALYWTIEETPSDYWTPERLVFCVDICFQRLISWVETGFCPNYFLRENNMFLGKVQEWQLAYIASQLSEIHNEGWRCLLKCHSLSHFKKALEIARKQITPHSFPISNPEEDYKVIASSLRKPIIRETHREEILDSGLFGEILSRHPKKPSVDILEVELRNSLTLEIKQKMNSSDLDIIRLHRYHNLSQLALIYLNMSLTKGTTRERYRYIRKAFCYLNHARFADISKGNLTLATAHYCLGRFSSALTYIKEYEERLELGLGYIYCGNRNAVYTVGNYEESMCGQGFGSMEKASLAVSYDFEIFRMMPLVPIELALEVVMMKNTESRVVIPPKMYSVFLKILCYSNMGDLKMVEQLSPTLGDCLAFATPISRHLNYIMLAVTANKLGKYEDALRYYCLAHNCKRILIMKNSGCPEYHSRTSCLFYIAQLLRMLL